MITNHFLYVSTIVPKTKWYKWDDNLSKVIDAITRTLEHVDKEEKKKKKWKKRMLNDVQVNVDIDKVRRLNESWKSGMDIAASRLNDQQTKNVEDERNKDSNVDCSKTSHHWTVSLFVRDRSSRGSIKLSLLVKMFLFQMIFERIGSLLSNRHRTIQLVDTIGKASSTSSSSSPSS